MFSQLKRAYSSITLSVQQIPAICLKIIIFVQQIINFLSIDIPFPVRIFPSNFPLIFLFSILNFSQSSFHHQIYQKFISFSTKKLPTFSNSFLLLVFLYFFHLLFFFTLFALLGQLFLLCNMLFNPFLLLHVPHLFDMSLTCYVTVPCIKTIQL